MMGGGRQPKIDDFYQSIRPAIDAAFQAFLHLQDVTKQAEQRLLSLTVDEMQVVSRIDLHSQDVLDMTSSIVATAMYQVAAVGRAGWLLPRNFPFGQLRKVHELLQTSGPVLMGESITKLYTARDHLRLNSLVGRVGENGCLQEHKTVIEDCLFAYNCNRFALVIPTLLTLIEGVVVRGLGQVGNKKAKNAHKTWSVSSAKPTQSIGMISWTAIDSFLSVLWADAPFDQQCPPFLNRHWIMHGRWARPFEQQDALKLFLALVTIGDYFHHLVHE